MDPARILLKHGQTGFELTQNSVPTMKPLRTHSLPADPLLPSGTAPLAQTPGALHRPTLLTLLQPKALLAVNQRQNSPSLLRAPLLHPMKRQGCPKGQRTCVLPTAMVQTQCSQMALSFLRVKGTVLSLLNVLTL